MADHYRINEIFYSIQGEGMRAGTANVFVRFARCNLRCSKDGPEGFDCDTEFDDWGPMSKERILERMDAATEARLIREQPAVILTGGEPALQCDTALLTALKAAGYYVAMETNGTVQLFGASGSKRKRLIDWLCVSPKTPDSTLKVRSAEEVKFVMAPEAPLPVTRIKTTNRLLSPRFNADGTIDEDALAWCIRLVGLHPDWRLSVQQHKGWGVR